MSLIGDQGDQGDQQNTKNENMGNSQDEIFTDLHVPHVPSNSQADDYLDIFRKTDNEPHVPPGPQDRENSPVLTKLMTRLINAYGNDKRKSHTYLQTIFTDNEIDEFVMIGILEVCENSDDLLLCV